MRIHRHGLARYALEQFEEATEDFAKFHQVGGLGYRDLQFQDEVKIGLYEPTLTSLFNSRRSELFTAVKMGDLATVQRVIEAGIPIRVMIGYNFQSPLHAAAWEGHADITRALLDGGADPSFSDWEGQTPLFMVAGGSGEVGVITELLEFGALPNIRNERGEMPLHVAAFKGHVAAATALLNGGAEVDAKTTDAVSSGGLTPLHLAAAQGHKPLVELLLAQGADPQAPDDYSRTPLFKAVSTQGTEVLEVFLNHGADVSAQDHDGNTPLHIAAESGRADMAEILLAHSADPQTLNVDGATPLELAGAHGHLAVAALLRPESPISDTLFDAIDAGNLERVQQLLDEGADLQVLDRTGSTPLHRAARAGHADLGRVLLADGAEVNTGTPEGTPPCTQRCGEGMLK